MTVATNHSADLGDQNITIYYKNLGTLIRDNIVFKLSLLCVLFLFRETLEMETR